jgi:hypothetical protein
MRFYNQNGELDGTSHPRTYGDEIASALSAFDCSLNGRKALYASSELTTGRRLFELMKEVGVLTPEELRTRIGDAEYRRRLWDPNLAEALDFARQVRDLTGRDLVLTPGPFIAPGWNQEEYLALWETVIRTRIEALYFGPDWEYSNGCAFEFSVARDQGLPTFDATGAPMSREAGTARIAAAAADLASQGFEVPGLHLSLARLRRS